MMSLELACQELNLDPMLINNMIHDGKPQVISWIARHCRCLDGDWVGTVTVVVILLELWGKQPSLVPPQGRP